MRRRQKPLVASMLLVAMPGAPSSFLFLVVRPGAPSSVLGAQVVGAHGLCESGRVEKLSILLLHLTMVIEVNLGRSAQRNIINIYIY